MNAVAGTWFRITHALDSIGTFLPQLGLRLLLAFEFWESGVMKLNATGPVGGAPSWFANLDYPFPFNILPDAVNWFIAMWTELIGAILVAIGFATRLAVIALIILDIVAWISVHAGSGYNVCDNGWKLPLMYLILFLPLLFSGPGKASIDHLIAKKVR